MGQDFVLDDLRILLTNVSRQVDSIEEQMKDIISGRPSLSNSNESCDTSEIKVNFILLCVTRETIKILNYYLCNYIFAGLRIYCDYIGNDIL